MRLEGGKETIRLFTTLTATDISATEIASLYHERGEEETVIDKIKTHLCSCQTMHRAVIFRSQSPERVEQERYGLLLAYNVVMSKCRLILPALSMNGKPSNQVFMEPRAVHEEAG